MWNIRLMAILKWNRCYVTGWTHQQYFASTNKKMKTKKKSQFNDGSQSGMSYVLLLLLFSVSVHNFVYRIELFSYKINTQTKWLLYCYILCGEALTRSILRLRVESSYKVLVYTSLVFISFFPFVFLLRFIHFNKFFKEKEIKIMKSALLSFVCKQIVHIIWVIILFDWNQMHVRLVFP